MAEHNEIGDNAEQLAAEYLLAKKYTILNRNYRHSRFEIDIIATKNDTLHFIDHHFDHHVGISPPVGLGTISLCRRTQRNSFALFGDKL